MKEEKKKQFILSSIYEIISGTYFLYLFLVLK
jgi:hypothetical protein